MKANFGAIRDALASHYNTFKESSRESTVNEIWKTFETKLKQLMEKNITIEDAVRKIRSTRHGQTRI